MSTNIIVLTGPESCGKTTLAHRLSEHWNAPLVHEASRGYLQEKPDYEQEDLLQIAKLQQSLEQESVQSSPAKLICDTDLLVIIVWSEVKYGGCDPWITQTFEESQQLDFTSRLYCLCDYHLPWEHDPLRENPDNRDELFEIYLEKLKYYDLNYLIVDGDSDERMSQVVDTIF